MSRYSQFDRQRLDLKPLAERDHDLVCSACLPLEQMPDPFDHPEFPEFIAKILAGRRNGRPVVLMMGAHPIKLGLSRFLIDLVDRCFINHVATNGAGIIHDFELALVGGTSEDVAKWIQVGQFGLWKETAGLNDIIREAAERHEGIGEAVGRIIQERQFPHRDLRWVDKRAARFGTSRPPSLTLCHCLQIIDTVRRRKTTLPTTTVRGKRSSSVLSLIGAQVFTSMATIVKRSQCFGIC
jgi:hypothetical protein